MAGNFAAALKRPASFRMVVLAWAVFGCAVPRAPGEPAQTPRGKRAGVRTNAPESAPENAPENITPRAEAPPAWLDELTAHVLKTRGSEVLPLEISEDGYSLFGHPIDHLPDVFAKARRVRTTRHEVLGRDLVFEYQRITYGDWTLYDSEREFVSLASEDLAHRRSGEEGHMNSTFAMGVRPLSLVGTVFTYETVFACACGGGPPGSDVSWSTVDLATRKPPKLTQLLEADSLLSALQKDPCIKPLLSNSHSRPGSLDEIIGLLESEPPASSNCFGAAQAFKNFTFAGYDPKTDQVIVKLGFPYEISPGHQKMSYLGLLVQPQSSFREALLHVSDDNGFFFSESP